MTPRRFTSAACWAGVELNCLVVALAVRLVILRAFNPIELAMLLSVTFQTNRRPDLGGGLGGNEGLLGHSDDIIPKFFIAAIICVDEMRRKDG